MMKRFISFDILLLFFLCSLFSTSSYSGASTNGSASMTVELNADTILSDKPRVYCGFTTDGTTSGTITPLSSDLVLTKTFKDMVYFYASGTAYVFLRIASSQKLSFTLSWEKLTSENSEKNLYISKDGDSISTGDVIYSFNPEEDAIMDKRIELKFSTGNSAIDAIENLYSTVTLTVKAES